MIQFTKTYLFDWGDTLMVDFPSADGKMCTWEKVAAVPGAKEALLNISKKAQIYIATGAADSNETDIQAAFMRVHLDCFITGYFCKANLGIEKGTPEYFPRILKILNQNPDQVTMVGDSLEKDILPALKCGINGIWLSKNRQGVLDIEQNVQIIRSLRELYI